MMRRVRALVLRAAALVRGGRTDAEFAAELDSHLQLHISDNLRAGMTPDAARRAALVRLGGVTQTREAYRDRERLAGLDTVRQDLGYAIRVLRQNPGFTTAAILTLALGIGANTAIFSIVNAVLLRPLPFPDPDRLVMIFATNATTGNITDVASHPDYLDWARAAAFERAGALVSRNVTIDHHGEAEYLSALRMSASLFDTLGVQPALGRGFRPEEEQPGAPKVVILTDAFWNSHFGGDAGVLGRTLRIDEDEYTVVGVAPPTFRAGIRAQEQLYLPLVVDPNRNHGFLQVVARLRRESTIGQARAELGVIAAQLAAAYPRSNANVGANLMPLVDAMAVHVRTALFVLLGVVGVVLLIACTNVASLMLARGTARRRELAVRAALGAGRLRLIRQLLTESVLLASLGGAAGFAVGSWLTHGLASLLAHNLRPATIPRIETAGIDGRVLAFTVLVSLLTGIIFGVAPALASASPDLNRMLRDDSRSTTPHRAPLLRRSLVVLEIALALMLLAGAGVLLKSFVALRTAPRGFESDHVLAVDLWLPQPRFAALADRSRFYGDALSRLRATPGVVSAGFVADLPLNGGSDSLAFHIVGRPDPTPTQSFQAGFNIASADYFRTMRIPVRSGRVFTDDDRPESPGVVVINETAARQFWPNDWPIGHQIALPLDRDQPEAHERGSGNTNPNDTTFTVIGVVGDVRDIRLSSPARPEVYLDSIQAELPWPWAVLAVRSVGNPELLAGTVRDCVRSADANVPLLRFTSMDDVVSKSVAEPRIYAILLGGFAALALLLAAIGLYGLVSYAVSQRTHEIGVRVALGAARREILGLLLAQGLRLALVGTAIGILGAVALTRVLVSLVNGVQPNDPVAFASVSILLIGVALAATYLPARRAARVDPVVALRCE